MRRAKESRFGIGRNNRTSAQHAEKRHLEWHLIVSAKT